jgi:hypothetical protein
MSELQFDIDSGFKATRRPVRLTTEQARSLYGDPWLEETRRPQQGGLRFALWLLVALACVSAGVWIDQGSGWLIP